MASNTSTRNREGTSPRDELVRQQIVALPEREMLSLVTMPSLTDPSLTGTGGGTPSTPTTTSPSEFSSTAVPQTAADPTRLPIVSKLDPSRLGIL